MKKKIRIRDKHPGSATLVVVAVRECTLPPHKLTTLLNNEEQRRSYRYTIQFPLLSITTGYRYLFSKIAESGLDQRKILLRVLGLQRGACKKMSCMISRGQILSLWPGGKVDSGIGFPQCKCVGVDSGVNIRWGYSQLRHWVPYTMFFFGFGLCFSLPCGFGSSFRLRALRAFPFHKTLGQTFHTDADTDPALLTSCESGFNFSTLM